MHRRLMWPTLYNVCSIHRGMFSTSGGYNEYTESVQCIRGISWCMWGDIISTSVGYHEYIEGCSVHRGDIMMHVGDIMMHVGEQIDKNLSISIENPDVLMISPWCTHDIPLMYSWYPPDVLMISPRCTEHPPMYWTSPNILNTRYTGWWLNQANKNDRRARK